MSRHVYWQPSDVRPSKRPVSFVVAWFCFLVFFVVVWQLAELAPGARPLLFGALAVALVGFVVVVVRRATSSEFVTELQAAELARLREHTGDAVTLARAMMSKPLTEHQQVQVLLLLGMCAESEGDFAEAADTYVKAEGVLRAGTMHRMVRAQHLALVAARRAFAHAACGELERAQAALAVTHLRDGFPLATALACRAELVIAAKQAQAEGPAKLRAKLDEHATLLRNTLAWRNRALVHVLNRMTSSHESQLELEPAVREWVVKVMGPSVEPLLRPSGDAA